MPKREDYPDICCRTLPRLFSLYSCSRTYISTGDPGIPSPDGVRTKVVPSVNQNNIGKFLIDNIAQGSIINTDQSHVYKGALWPLSRRHDTRHDVVNHSKKEYARRNPDGTVSHVNCCESFFSLLKRGLMGTFHAVSPEHLHRYANEFAFRWDTRRLNDGERVVEAIKRGESKRLTYENYVCR